MARKPRYKEGMVDHPNPGERIADAIILLILAACMFAAIIPMWHTLMASLSDGNLLVAHEGVVWKWITSDGAPNWGGYKRTLNYSDFAILKSYGVTILYVVAQVVFGLIINVIGGYVIYRQPKAASGLMLLFVFALMFNGGTVPTYMVLRKLGMTGTPWAMMIPGCTNAMFIIMTLNAFRQVPQSTVEAAEIDGAGHFTIMFRVMLPQAMGLITVTMINTAVLAWNSWFNAMLYVPTQQQWWPLQLWIKQIVADNATMTTAVTPDWNRYLVSYCVILVATVPVLIAMPFAQKQLQKGALIGGVKE